MLRAVYNFHLAFKDAEQVLDLLTANPVRKTCIINQFHKILPAAVKLDDPRIVKVVNSPAQNVLFIPAFPDRPDIGQVYPDLT